MWKKHKFSDKIDAFSNSVKKQWNQLKISDKIQLALFILQLFLVIGTLASVMFAYWAVHINENALQKSDEFSNKSMNLSKQALCIQKDIEYRNIAPPSIVVSLKDTPMIQDNRTAMMTFRFHIIPNSKTYFYPDADLDITNSRGFSDDSGVEYLDNIEDINHLISIVPVKEYFPYPPLDYRNETIIDIAYGIFANEHSEINFGQYPRKTPINVSMNFTFKLKDAYGDKYNATVSYNITIGEGNIESINQPKVFDFKRPENYIC